MPGIIRITSFFLLYQAFLVSAFTQTDKNKQTDIVHYNLCLDVNDSNTYLSGYCAISLINKEVNVPGLEFELTGNFQIDSVLINAQKVTFNHKNDTVFVSNIFFEKDKIYTATIFYSGFGTSINGRGIISNNKGFNKQWVTWTLCEPFYSKYWFPVKQDLNDKADSVTATLITSPDIVAVSNGILYSKKINTDGNLEFTWKCKYPISYYLISIAVSKYREYSFYHRFDNQDSMIINNYIYNAPEYLDREIENLNKTSEIMSLYDSLFGSYPFKKERYGHAVAPVGGGMEHQTITTISAFNFSLVAHELAHQWWGNLVTCSSWQDIWINEGFASYAEYLAYEFLGQKDEAGQWLQQTLTDVLQVNDGSVYVSDYPDSSRRIFDSRLSYDKGAVIIHLLRKEINDDKVFFDILKTFLNQYAYKNASGEDFKEVTERITGKNFDHFFNSWYYGNGFPEFNVLWYQNADKVVIEINKQRDYQVTLPFKFIYFNGKDTSIQINSNKLKTTDSVIVAHPVRNVMFIDNHDLLAKLNGIKLKPSFAINKDIKIVQDYLNRKIKVYSYIDQDFILNIYNLNGVQVRSLENTHRYFEINTTDLAYGINILEIITNDKRIFRMKIFTF